MINALMLDGWILNDQYRSMVDVYYHQTGYQRCRNINNNRQGGASPEQSQVRPVKSGFDFRVQEGNR